MTDAKDAPMCRCGDDWHANNAANHSPSCPVLDHIATLTRERDGLLVINGDLARDNDALIAERDEARDSERQASDNDTFDARDELWRLETDVGAALTPFGCWFMDPPDGGDVSLGEQVKRMSAELVQTRQQRDDMQQDEAGLIDTITQLRSEVEELRQQRDEARRDVERLDWLESRKSYSLSNLGGMECAHLYVSSGGDVRVTISSTKPTIREAIDAARSASE